LATTVLLQESSVLASPKFYGRNARGIRRHYSWLPLQTAGKGEVKKK